MHLISITRVVHGSLFLGPTRPGETLTRPDPRLPTNSLREKTLRFCTNPKGRPGRGWGGGQLPPPAPPPVGYANALYNDKV